MRIAVAQHSPKAGAVEENIEKHLKLIQSAIDQNCDAIFFNELSLTSYEPDRAFELQMGLDDPRLTVFQELSNLNDLVIVIGLPLTVVDGIQIASVIFQPDQSRAFYSKQILHESESAIFIPGKEQMILTIKEKKVAMGICYESLQESHFSNCVALGTDIYIVSTAKKQEGLQAAMDFYSYASKKYQIPVMMSNSNGITTRFECVGNSAVWNNGVLLNQLSKDSESILFLDF
mgnify:CR=1 FL=1